MNSCQDVAPRLSDYLDDTLAPETRAMVRAHLADCDACRGDLADFQRVRDAARALGPIVPPERVWSEIARRTVPAGAGMADGKRPGLRRELVQWAALAAALLLVTVSVYFFTRKPASPVTVAVDRAGNAAGTGSVEGVEQELQQAESHYDAAIVQLEAVTTSGSSTLDPAVAGTLQRNVEVIDHAIAESKNALHEDPASAPARDSLFEALRQKVSLLQNTVALINEMRKGDQAGAARLVGGDKSS